MNIRLGREISAVGCVQSIAARHLFLVRGGGSSRACNLAKRPSVCMHDKTREPLNGFVWNLIMGSFNTICRHVPVLVKTWSNITDTWRAVLHTRASSVTC
jgi:hypothetical protein